MPKTGPKIIHMSSIDSMLVEIRDEGDYRSLYFDGDTLQSRMSLSAPHELTLPYTRFMMLPLLYTQQVKNILLIGVGSGSLLRFMRHHFPKCRQDGVDCSQPILDLARGYFQCPDDERCHLHPMDGCDFLEHCSNRYDLIFLDAFDHHGMAPSIYNRFVLELCAARLTPGGSLSANLWSGHRGRLNQLKTFFHNCFEDTIYLPVPNRGNVVSISTPAPFPWKTIEKKRKLLRKTANTLQLDFNEMLKIARQNNLSVAQRLRFMFA